MSRMMMMMMFTPERHLPTPRQHGHSPQISCQGPTYVLRLSQRSLNAIAYVAPPPFSARKARTTIKRLLRNIRLPLDPRCVCHTPYTILEMAISRQCHPMPIPTWPERNRARSTAAFPARKAKAKTTRLLRNIRLPPDPLLYWQYRAKANLCLSQRGLNAIA